VLGPLLAPLDPVEALALDLQGAVRLLREVVGEAAVDRLAGRPRLVAVGAAAEDRLVPILGRRRGVVLDVGVLDADDGEAEDFFLPDGRRRRAVAAAGEAGAATRAAAALAGPALGPGAAAAAGPRAA